MIIRSSADIVLKKAEQIDIDTINRWYCMTDNLGYATGEKDFSEIAQIIQSSTEINALIFMIYERKSDYPIGFTYANINEIATKTILWIRILLIDPCFQNKGFGTVAVKKLFSYAKLKHKALSSVITVSDNNIKGLAFWEKVGFSRARQLEALLHRDGTYGVSVMKKDI